MHFQAAIAFGLWLLNLAWCRPQFSNPIEQLSLGAMNMAGNIAEAIQAGAAINRNMNFDTPLMSVHSKTAAGYGDAVRPPSADSSESDERRRRRSLSHLYLQRVKRDPCFMKMKMTTEASDDDIDARRRRAQKRAANNASRTRINQINKKKKKFYRRRRQAGPDQQMIGFGDRIKGMWLSFVDNMVNVVQQVGQKISSTAGQAAGMAANGPQK